LLHTLLASERVIDRHFRLACGSNECTLPAPHRRSISLFNSMQDPTAMCPVRSHRVRRRVRSWLDLRRKRKPMWPVWSVGGHGQTPWNRANPRRCARKKSKSENGHTRRL